MRISDWSSDVCSSDLRQRGRGVADRTGQLDLCRALHERARCGGATRRAEGGKLLEPRHLYRGRRLDDLHGLRRALERSGGSLRGPAGRDEGPGGGGRSEERTEGKKRVRQDEYRG